VNVSQDKLAVLVEGGLTELRMGIQTASERTKKLYKRNYANKTVKRAINIIHEFKDTITPTYDIIVNNPWETDEDQSETLQFLTQIPGPYRLNMFALTFYPETDLYRKAVADRIVKDDLNDVYRQSYNLQADGLSGKLVGESYLTNLFYLIYVHFLYGRGMSEKTMSVMCASKTRPIMSRVLYFHEEESRPAAQKASAQGHSQGHRHRRQKPRGPLVPRRARS
tara:strand:- start:58 stop:726 length:669 start_codon:yes stop_codon:yes gene_type:complete